MTAEVERVRGEFAARVARARHLADRRPAGAEVLGFYAAVATAQGELLADAPRVLRPGHAGGDAARLDAAVAAALAPALTATLRAAAPPGVATRLAGVADAGVTTWREWCVAAWPGAAGGDASAADAPEQFVVEVLLQPFAAVWASSAPPRPRAGATWCPRCGDRAVVARLDERGHGAARALVCGRCLTAWDVPRAVCPACGQMEVAALPVFRDGDLPAIRLDACDRCRVYVKGVDLTVDGHAEPIADDLASWPLDLWAVEQGYRRVRPNLLRL
ncbi:MAG: formate dehydrogenase accessory protein FdhE [Vicinamibacterales bacterium]